MTKHDIIKDLSNINKKLLNDHKTLPNQLKSVYVIIKFIIIILRDDKSELTALLDSTIKDSAYQLLNDLLRVL